MREDERNVRMEEPLTIVFPVGSTGQVCSRRDPGVRSPPRYRKCHPGRSGDERGPGHRRRDPLCRLKRSNSKSLPIAAEGCIIGSEETLIPSSIPYLLE